MSIARTLSFAGLAGSIFASVLAAQACGGSSTTETPADGGSSKGSSSHSTSGSSATTGTTGSKGSSTTTTTTTSSTTTTTMASNTPMPADAGGLPPAMMGNPTTSTQVHNFAIHHLYVGDDDPTPSYTADPNAWKTIGFNLDGLDTTSKSTNVCTPYTKGQTAQQADGANGIDNAFGAIVVQALGQLGLNLSQTVSEKIIGGSFTIEIDTKGLDSTNTSLSATALGGQLFAGGAYTGGAPPLTGNYFSITDNWPVDQALLANGTIAGGSKLVFPAAYVTNGTWVSGTPINLSLALSLEGQTLSLTIHHALISFDYSVSGSQGLATKGIIAGVLETQEFITAINQVLGGISGGSYCSLAQSLFFPTILGAQDIIINADGSVSNTAGTACNGISIGLAFDADEIAVPSVIAAGSDAGTLKPCPGADAG
jgi:hypothetical protein